MHLAASKRIPSNGGLGDEDISLPHITRRPDTAAPRLVQWNDIRHSLSVSPSASLSVLLAHIFGLWPPGCKLVATAMLCTEPWVRGKERDDIGVFLPV